MSTNGVYQMTGDQKHLLSSLLASDEEQGRPQLPPETLELAREYLSLLLLAGAWLLAGRSASGYRGRRRFSPQPVPPGADSPRSR
jgi:hypothetical protein